jgi:hypothetical protein
MSVVAAQAIDTELDDLADVGCGLLDQDDPTSSMLRT